MSKSKAKKAKAADKAPAEHKVKVQSEAEAKAETKAEVPAVAEKPKAAASAEASQQEVGDVLRVQSKAEGFRRAGIRFTAAQEMVLPLKSLTKKQIEAIHSEPMLVVIDQE